MSRVLNSSSDFLFYGFASNYENECNVHLILPVSVITDLLLPLSRKCVEKLEI